MRLSPLPLVLVMALAGCVNLAPDYQRPAAPVAEQWPGTTASSSNSADIAWQALFVDARLRDTVALALANNRDLRVAALNVRSTVSSVRRCSHPFPPRQMAPANAA